MLHHYMKNALLMLLLTLCTSCNCTVVLAPHVGSPSSPSPPPSPYSPSPPYSPSSSPAKQTTEEVICNFNPFFNWLDPQYIKVLCPYIVPKFWITIIVWVTLCIDGTCVAWLLRIIVHSAVSKETYEQWWKPRSALPSILSFYLASIGIAFFVAEIYLLVYIFLLCVHVARRDPI